METAGVEPPSLINIKITAFIRIQGTFLYLLNAKLNAKAIKLALLGATFYPFYIIINN
ncbi:hypothetical protein ACFQU5_19895 [Ureibacillus sp. GCM10028918]